LYKLCDGGKNEYYFKIENPTYQFTDNHLLIYSYSKVQISKDEFPNFDISLYEITEITKSSYKLQSGNLHLFEETNCQYLGVNNLNILFNK